MIVKLDTFKQEPKNLTIQGMVILNFQILILQSDEG
jgi:hypothetical protein